MSSFFSPFSRSRAGDAWVPVGVASSFPDITSADGMRVSEVRLCAKSGSSLPGCKIFHVPRDDSSKASEVPIDEAGAPPETGGLRDQVLIFQFNGKFHAINHVCNIPHSARVGFVETRKCLADSGIQECPHSSYPLSNGAPFDIEDFGIVWSSGITCPKHGWSFDLSSGRGDRGSYKLQVWEVELRPTPGGNTEGLEGEVEKEVWVRRKQRMG